MQKCCHCRRDRPDEEMVHTVLTAEEKAFVLRTSGQSMDDFWECKPCRKVLSQKEAGAQLIKGTLQINLAARGHTNAAKISEKVYERLIKSAKGPTS